MLGVGCSIWALERACKYLLSRMTRKNEMKLLKDKRCSHLHHMWWIVGALLFWWLFDKK
jgi:hypothetical protein